MYEEGYSIVLSDGTLIEDLKLNGNNFVSSEPVTESMFLGKTAPVIIQRDDIQELHDRMELVQVVKMGEEYWFILRDIPDQEHAERKLKADVEYIAMMADIEL